MFGGTWGDLLGRVWKKKDEIKNIETVPDKSGVSWHYESPDLAGTVCNTQSLSHSTVRFRRICCKSGNTVASK